MEFVIKFEIDEEEDWIASCDLLPSVTSFGDTKHEALREYCDALAGVLDVLKEDGETIF